MWAIVKRNEQKQIYLPHDSKISDISLIGPLPTYGSPSPPVSPPTKKKPGQMKGAAKTAAFFSVDSGSDGEPCLSVESPVCLNQSLFRDSFNVI